MSTYLENLLNSASFTDEDYARGQRRWDYYRLIGGILDDPPIDPFEEVFCDLDEKIENIFAHRVANEINGFEKLDNDQKNEGKIEILKEIINRLLKDLLIAKNKLKKQ